ncbi:DUF922 domain-containing protein [Mucilaginibacter sp. OK098]|uniref:DUF922 domain-containing protein n=1 Tax=Mucilaginibacter sp. OK098 TaxID=1855297 RepID=UPI0009118652|nr:DUF922 domain-containing protein [Mucilaginibacter sp. OK098]SHM70535.1 protein of unknown function [Mucilaginibacter sp. OK098]
MKFGFVRLISFTAMWLCIVNNVSAQAFRQLTVNDFKGIPVTNQSTVAYTNCSISFQYEAHRERNFYLLDFNIQLTLNDCKSWIDKKRITSDQMLTEVLKHEQGHYLIAYMEQQELLRTVSKTIFYANYQSAAQNIFNRIDAKYKQLNMDYDADTQHMQNRTQQQSWDAYFKKRLTYMPPQ